MKIEAIAAQIRVPLSVDDASSLAMWSSES
jgi:hypothetical protein